MTYKVIITDPIAEEGIKILQKDPEIEVDYRPEIPFEELLEIIEPYHAIITRSRTPVNKELLERAKNLKVVGRAGVGVDNVDLQECSKRGILVVNTPGANTIGATELTMMHMLTIMRNGHKAHSSVAAGKWERKKFMGEELYGKKLGIIGLGNIGSQVAIRSKAFGMDVYAYDPYIPRSKADRLGVKLVDNLEDMLKEIDVLTIHAPLTEETLNMISKPQLELMKDGVYIVNCARGGIINQEDLVEVAKTGKIKGIALDVFKPEPPPKEFIDALLELWEEGKINLSLSPHIGANTRESQANVAIMVAQQVIKALKGETPEHVVNAPFPDLSALTLIKPILDLAEKMGRFIVQWAGVHPREVKVEVYGDIAEHVKPITAAVLSGILKETVDYPVNILNAPFLAKEKGIRVEEVASSDSPDFKHLVKVTVYTDQGKRSVAGSVLEGYLPRFVQIDNFKVYVEPEGILLVFENKDLPGVIGKIGNILGKFNVNIAGFKLGREKRGGRAIGILNLDEPAPEEALNLLRQIPEIISLKQIKL
ncbi:MAG: phosphoglycerate dehydrogenase [Aquificota bacterium]